MSEKYGSHIRVKESTKEKFDQELLRVQARRGQRLTHDEYVCFLLRAAQRNPDLADEADAFTPYEPDQDEPKNSEEVPA